MKFIDLTHTIDSKIPAYPSDSPVDLYQDRQIDKDQYNNFILNTGMHTGTHIDGPMHLTDSKDYIKDIPLDRFIGNACLLDVRYQNVISSKQIFNDDIKENDIVLLYTGFGSEFGNKKYFEEYPVIDKTFAELLIKKKIKMLGIDTPSPDKSPFDAHKLLLKNNILIIENMTNLEKLLFIENFEIIAFPLKIKADSSPVRVAARIPE